MAGVCFVFSTWCAAQAQSCTVLDTARPERAAVTSTAQAVGDAILTGDTSALAKLAGGDLARNFAGTAVLAATLHAEMAGDTIAPTYAYLLVQAASISDAAQSGDFVCTSAASTAETDFSIGKLPAGRYAFAMVDASGPHPWLLSLLFEEEAGIWKLAGLQEHARTAAGHDGLFYWKAAREAAKAGQAWRGWLDYGLAERLLRPATYVSSSNLDRLTGERTTAAPPALSDGLSLSSPLALRGADGQQFRVTALRLEPDAAGGLALQVVAAMASLPDAEAERMRNRALAVALSTAHPELRDGVSAFTIEAETEGQTPFTTSVPVTELH